MFILINKHITRIFQHTVDSFFYASLQFRDLTVLHQIARI